MILILDGKEGELLLSLLLLNSELLYAEEEEVAEPERIPVVFAAAAAVVDMFNDAVAEEEFRFFIDCALRQLLL